MKNNNNYTFRDKLYMWGYRISIKKANRYTLEAMFLENLSKINNSKYNGAYKHQLALQNKVLRMKLGK